MTHDFFRKNQVKMDAPTALENDARLALHIVLYLLSTQDHQTGCWNGDHLGASLRNTCHALEALHLFGPNVAANALELGTAWLINLSDIDGSSADDDEAIRLYPSRFKTLAWLARFDDPQIRHEFEQLSRHQDRSGALLGVMNRQSLATMVYADCLGHLASQADLPPLWVSRRQLALDYIDSNFTLWYLAATGSTVTPEVMNSGELSYVLDLLVRARRMTTHSVEAQYAQEVLLSAIEKPESWSPLSSDILYCALQLATHFPNFPSTRKALADFTKRLRAKYEKVDLRRETAFFHPLALRFLLAFNGDRLTSEVIRLLLEGEQHRLELMGQGQQQRLLEDFQALIKQRVEIGISDVEPLTGGITEANVYRMRYSLRLRASSETGETVTRVYQPDQGSIVIKRGRMDVLDISIRRYRRLPANLKCYFARHEDAPTTLSTGAQAPGYLVMEDLMPMRTLRDIVDEIDLRSLSRSHQERLRDTCSAVAKGLIAIYDATKRSTLEHAGTQLSRLYFGDLEKYLIRMGREGAFPHIKAWNRGFRLRNRKYRAIGHYLSWLEGHRAQLSVPYLMLVHGDCHSRNIMLDDQRYQIKLIDLDNLDYDGDYVKDLALLIEDVCVFRFLFDDNYRLQLARDQIKFISASADHRVIQNEIDYPPLTSPAVRLFQECMLKDVEAFALRIGDRTWKERLWLALAVSLMYLVPKHGEKEQATVLYVEAVKLLDDLVAHLSGQSPLPDLPFPGQHVSGPLAEEEPHARRTPYWEHKGSRLASLHEAILALDPSIACELDGSGLVGRYFSAGSAQPFTVVDARKRPPIVLLACSVQNLDDPAGLVHNLGSKSVFRAVLQMSEGTSTETAIVHVRRALLLNRSDGRLPLSKPNLA